MLRGMWLVLATGVALVVLVTRSLDRGPPSVRIGAATVHLRQGTIDYWIYTEVVRDDTYRLRRLALPPHPVIVDIGAQVGIFATYALSRYPDATLYGYEMDAQNFTRLQRNTSAVSDRVHVTRATIIGAHVPTGYVRDESNSGGHRVVLHGARGTLEIPQPMTLADILASNGIERIDLLKMDIEGAEYDVLAQAVADGSIHAIDRIALEWHDGRVQELVALLAPQFRVMWNGNGNVGLLFAERRHTDG